MNLIRTIGNATVIGMTAVSGVTFAAGSDTFPNGQSIYGQPSRGTTSVRVIDLGTAKVLNVEYGETVTFRSDGRQFSWTFNGFDHQAVNIAKIAPAGFATKPLIIYVERNPLTRN